jgi:hypothetical protein
LFHAALVRDRRFSLVDWWPGHDTMTFTIGALIVTTAFMVRTFVNDATPPRDESGANDEWRGRRWLFWCFFLYIPVSALIYVCLCLFGVFGDGVWP